jgi:gamma-glutamyl:cysteine ligase YbdK (ATP-grasp superfamily)
MFIALAQALVYQASVDYRNNNLHESFSSEFLSDSLWKASRFDFTSKIIDVNSDYVITMEDKIRQMLDYATPALNIFANTCILTEVDDIIKNGPEGDRQLNVFNRKGMAGLKEYLIDDVEYNIL